MQFNTFEIHIFFKCTIKQHTIVQIMRFNILVNVCIYLKHGKRLLKHNDLKCTLKWNFYFDITNLTFLVYKKKVSVSLGTLTKWLLMSVI